MVVPLFQDIMTTPGLSSPNVVPSFSHVMDGSGWPPAVHAKCAISPSFVCRTVAVLVWIDGPEEEIEKKRTFSRREKGRILINMILLRSVFPARTLDELEINCHPERGWGGSTGNLQNRSAFLETVSLFEINISYFVYPISDLIPNLIPYFRPLKLLVSNSWPNHAQPTWNGFYLRKSLRRGFYSPCLMAKKIVSTKQNNHFQATVKNTSHLRPKWSNLCSVSDENGGKKIISFDAYIMECSPLPPRIPILGQTRESVNALLHYPTRHLFATGLAILLRHICTNNCFVQHPFSLKWT